MSTLPAGQMPAVRQTPSAEATARAQCANYRQFRTYRLKYKVYKEYKAHLVCIAI